MKDITIRLIPTAEQHRYNVEVNEQWSHLADLTLPTSVSNALFNLHQRNVNERTFETLLEQDALCIQVGEFLFEALIGESSLGKELRANLAPTKPQSRLSLYLPQLLYQLPWELLRDRSRRQFLSLYHSVVRYYADGSGKAARFEFPIPNPCTDPIWLCIVADTTDLNYGKFDAPSYVKLLHPGQWADFTESVKKHQYAASAFIFLGHGEPASESDKYSSLVFVREEKIGMGLRRRQRIRDPRSSASVGTQLAKCQLDFGILLACESAGVKEGRPLEKTILGNLLEEAGFPILIGAQAEIGAQASLSFLDDCITKLQNSPGTELDEIVTDARSNLRADPDSEKSLDWWIPVFYARTTQLIVNTAALLNPLPPIGARN